MRKLLMMLLLLMTCLAAQGETPMIPEPMMPPVENVTEQLVFDLPDGGRYVVYQCGTHYNEGWQYTEEGWQMHFGRYLMNMPHHLRRDGDDPPAFSLVSDTGMQELRFCWNRERFAVCGWRSDEWDAVIEGEALIYTGRGGRVEETPLPHQWFVMTYGEMPQSPDEARQMHAINERSAAALAPGFTMYTYLPTDGGRQALARYGRVTEDGRYQMREITLTAEQGITRTVDSMLIPLTEAKASTLREIIASGTAMDNENFYTWNLLQGENTFDLTRMPVSGKILDGYLRSGYLILLTEENGCRYLNSITYGPGGGYAIERSPALPPDTYLDTVHPGENEISLEWNGFSSQAGYVLTGDNRWHLEWAMLPGGGGLGVKGGLMYVWDGDGEYYGVLPDTDLFRDGVPELPETPEEAISQLKRDDLAVVNNPDPADRLHLRVSPSRGAKSLGKFYNGTIVHVLAQKGDWVQVRVGSTELMTGWMMRKYLAFGDDIDSVEPAFAGMELYEEHQGSRAFADAWWTDTLDDMSPLSGGEEQIGVVDAEGKRPASYIVRNDAGEVGYVPQGWYWPGNG